MTPRPGKPGEDDETVPVGDVSAAELRSADQPTMALIRDRYTVIRVLGRGGMGEVFLCRDATLDLLVAVKFPTDTAGSQFLDEARNASRLNHPNIARIYHFDYEPGGRPFIVMEYVEGECLSEILKKGRLEVDKALELIDAVLAALETAHGEGIIHRDIKPRNIMITPSGQVKVLDFGLAKRIRESHDSQGGHIGRSSWDAIHQAELGRPAGTARYMAPEQARGEQDLDERCDIFAAGAVLFECLTGRPAFGAQAFGQTGVPAHERQVPPPSTLAPGISPVIDAVVAKALAKEREDRYESAAAMRNALPRRRPRKSFWSAARELMLETARSPRRLVAVGAFLLFLYFIPNLMDRGRQLLDKHPPEAVRLYQEGLAAIRDGTYYRASMALERAVVIDPGYSIARARLSESLFELEYTERANAELLKVLGEARPTRNAGLLAEALRMTFSNDFAGAAKKYEQLANSSSRADKAQALVDLGRSLERNNRSEEALSRYQEAIALNAAYPAAVMRSGILLDRLKRSGDSEQAFRRAEELYQALSNTEGQAEVWFQRGRLAFGHRRTGEAMNALNRSLALARTSGSVYQEIQAMLQMSGVQHLQAQPAEAEKTARSAIDLAQRAGITNLAARGQITLGNAFLVAGDYAKAEPAFKGALEYSRQHELGRHAARSLFSLASLHSQMGKSNLVIDEVDEASRYFRQGGFAREVTMCVLLRTRALRQMGRFEEALEGAQAQIKAIGPGADKTQLADLEDVVASTLTALERYPEALTAFQNVERVNRSLGDKVGIGFALSALARVTGRLGDFETAQRYLSEAAGIAGTPERGLKALLAQVTSIDAEIDLANGRNSAAASKARRAIEIAAGQQKRAAIESRLTLSMALARSGAGRSSLLTAREAVPLADDYGELYLRWRARATLAEAALAAGDAAEAREAAAEAARSFMGAGQFDSGWRAQVLLAEALRRLREPERAADAGRQAKALLERMRSSWPAGMFGRYLARPDLAIRPYQQFTAKETANVRDHKRFAPVSLVASRMLCVPAELYT